MAIPSMYRYLLLHPRLRNPQALLSVKRPYTSASNAAAEKYWKLLESNGCEWNLERTLSRTSREKLDSSVIEEIMRRCSGDRSMLGLRFFIWAGLQPDYRHSTLMYNKACKLLRFDEKPQTLSEVLEAYRKEGCLVSVKTFKVMLNLCREAKLAREALWVLKKMGEFNCRPDTTTYNVVIRLFSEKGEMDMVVGLMREMALIDLYPDMITYVAMIKGFCNVGQLDDACGLFKIMRQHGCSPNVVAYSALLDGVCKTGDLDKAFDLLAEMEKEGSECMPNVVTYTAVIQSFCEKGRSTEALAVLERMGGSGCSVNRVTVSTLMKGLCAEDRIGEAYNLINKVVAGGNISNDVCYSSLIMCLLQIKNIEEAQKVFRKMYANGMTPDGLACSSLIKLLCWEDRVLDGFECFMEMEKKEALTYVDSDVYSILLAELCKQGHLTEATKVVNAMHDKKVSLKAPYVDDIVEYLDGCGEGDLALQLRSIVGVR